MLLILKILIIVMLIAHWQLLIVWFNNRIFIWSFSKIPVGHVLSISSLFGIQFTFIFYFVFVLNILIWCLIIIKIHLLLKLLLRCKRAIVGIVIILLIKIYILILWLSILIYFISRWNDWWILILIFLYFRLNIRYVDLIILIITVWITLVRFPFPSIVTEIRLLNLNLWWRQSARLFLLRLFILWILNKNVRSLIAATYAIDSHSPLASRCFVLGTIYLSVGNIASIWIYLESFRQGICNLLIELNIILPSSKLFMMR